MEYLTYEEFERKVYEIDSPIPLRINEDLNRKTLRVVKADNRFGEALVEIDKEHKYRMLVQPSAINPIPSWRKELEDLSWQLAGTPIEERREKEYIFPMGKDIDNVNVYAAFKENFVDQTCSITPARIKIMYTREELDKLIVEYPYLEPFIAVHRQLWKSEVN